MMKRAIFLLACCLVSGALFAQESGKPEAGSYSISLSPLSLATIAVLGLERGSDPNQAFWGSLSFNIDQSGEEHAFGFTKYPNYLSLYAEDRHFRYEDCTGFFYASFISADFISLSIRGDHTPIFSTEPYTCGDSAFLVGLRLGGDIGYRFAFDGWGITPKLGLAIPVFYLFDLDPYRNRTLLKIYESTAMLYAIDIGFKIDLMGSRYR